MRLPSKVTPFSDSVISLFPTILECLEQQDMSPHDLFERLSSGKDISVFMNALDCLFALGQIEIKEETGVLHYVGRNSV